MITASFGITIDKTFTITNCPHLVLTNSPTLVIHIATVGDYYSPPPLKVFNSLLL